jgi:hypothetical protein
MQYGYYTYIHTHPEMLKELLAGIIVGTVSSAIYLYARSRRQVTYVPLHLPTPPPILSEIPEGPRMPFPGATPPSSTLFPEGSRHVCVSKLHSQESF